MELITGWIIEPAILIITLNVIVKMIATYMKRVDLLTKSLWDVTLRCKALSDHLDYEFDLMKRCTKSVEAASIDYNTFYMAVKENSRTLTHALCQTQTILPIEITRRLSSILVPSRIESFKDLLSGMKTLASKMSLRSSYTTLKQDIPPPDSDNVSVFSIHSLGKKELELVSNDETEEGSVMLMNSSGESLIDSPSSVSVEGGDVLDTPFCKERRQIILIPNLEVIPDEAENV